MAPIPRIVSTRLFNLPSLHARSSRCWASCLLLLAACIPIDSALGQVAPSVYVSPTGNDSDPGTISNPLATLTAAKNLASTRVKTPDGSGGYLYNEVNIYLRAGEYPLLPPAAQPMDPGLEITHLDTRPGATIRIANTAGEVATVHGAITIPAGGGTLGSWQNVATYSAYNGGSTSTATPAGFKSVSGVKKFVFTGATRQYLVDRRTALQAQGINGGAFTITQLFGGPAGTTPIRKTRARHPNLKGMNADTSPFTGATKADQQAKVIIPARWFDNNTSDGDGLGLNLVTDGKTEFMFTRVFEAPRAIITAAYEVAPGSTPKAALEFSAMTDPGLVADPLGNYPNEIYLAEVHKDQPVAAGAETWNRGWAENNLLFLDREKEWFFDDDAVELYYFPPAGENVTLTEYRIPITHTLIRMRGTEASLVDGVDITGSFVGTATPNTTSPGKLGLRFAWTNWCYENGRGRNDYYSFVQGAYGLSGAIDGMHITNFRLEKVDMRGIGANAVSLGGNRQWNAGSGDNDDYYNQPRGVVSRCVIFDNYMTDLGAAGVRLDNAPRLDSNRFWSVPNDPDSPYTPNDENEIESNVINGGGEVFFDSAAILVQRSINTLVKANSIVDVPFIGISLGWFCYKVNRTDLTQIDPETGLTIFQNGERNVIEGNGIVRAMRMLVDGGAIYTAGSKQVRINNNTIVDTSAVRDNWAIVLPYAPTYWIADIYLDAKSYSFNLYSNSVVNSLGTGFKRGSSHTLDPLVTWLSKDAVTNDCPNQDEDCCTTP